MNVWSAMLITSFSFAMVSCSTLPGDVRSYESQVEKTKAVTMEPGWATSSGILIGAHKTSTMPKDEVEISAGYNIIKNIGDGESLVFSIDGDRIAFTSVDKITDFTTGSLRRSMKRYIVKVEFVKKLLNGKKVFVRVNTLDGTYIEGEFMSDTFTTARGGLPKFLAAIEKIN